MGSIETCVALCRWHHLMAHEGQLGTLETLRGWAQEHGYSVAADSLARRAEKIKEARNVR